MRAFDATHRAYVDACRDKRSQYFRWIVVANDGDDPRGDACNKGAERGPQRIAANLPDDMPTVLRQHAVDA